MTARAYSAAHAALALWARSRGLLPATPGEWDAALDMYLDELFLNGDNPSAGRYAIYGSAYVLGLPPRANSTFPLAKAALAGFGRASPERPRDSLSDEFLVLVTADWFYGDGDDPGDGPEAAAASWVAFDCYLRPSEVLALTANDITLPRPGCPDTIVTVAPATGALPAKNRVFDASTVAGVHNRGWISELLASLCRRRPVGPLFRLSLSRWESMCRKFRTQHFSASLPLSPHSWRHAGPSHDSWFFKVSESAIQQRGRWLSSNSVKRYSKPAGMLRSRSLLTPAHLNRVKQLRPRLSDDLLEYFKGPNPTRPPVNRSKKVSGSVGTRQRGLKRPAASS